MKNYKLYLFAAMAIFLLAACGGDDKPEGEKTFQQSVTLSATNADETVILTGLTKEIDEIEGGADWLTVIKQAYSERAQSLRLKATDNDSENPRSCTLTITVTNGDKVVIAVTQHGAEKKTTGIDDSHDIVTDQPAYSRID